MSETIDKLATTEIASIRARRLRFKAISAVEGIELTPEMEDAFEMFDRERWPHVKRRDYILAWIADAKKAACWSPRDC